MRIFSNKSDVANAVVAMAVALTLVGCDSGAIEPEAENTGLENVSSDPSDADNPANPAASPTGESGEPGNEVTGGSGLVVGSPDTTYEFLRLAGDSECLTVNEAGNYQLIGSYLDSDSQLVSEDLSGFATVGSTVDSSVSVISLGDNGISLQVNETTIAAIPMNVGDQTTTQYLSAIPATTPKPVIVARQTQEWCAYVIYGSNGSCASVTNSRVSDGQTVTIMAAASASIIGSNGDEITISSRNCELDNPQNITVMQVGN
jgi:hypothetical protein